jgi:competence protein ComEA
VAQPYTPRLCRGSLVLSNLHRGRLRRSRCPNIAIAVERIVDFSIRHVVTGLLIVAAMAAMSGAGLLIARSATSQAEIEVILPQATPTPLAGFQDLQVYLSGAVVNPGVYPASDGDRLADVVAAAGGMRVDADANRVNLAVRVSDEDHWDIPTLGEHSPGDPSLGGSGTDLDVAGSESAETNGGQGKIDLNRAEAALLQTLPNIGEVKAASIVAYRQANGPFLEVEELVEVSGIGDKTMEALRDLVEIR